jgi:hypothetical protein
MRKTLFYLFLIVGIQSVSFAFNENIGVGIGLGSGGYELKGIYRFSEYFSASLDYNAMGLDNISMDDLGSSGQDISASGTLQISSVNGLINFHPFASGFRVSAGYGYNLSDISIAIEGENVDIGGGNTADLEGTITIDTGSTLPYLGVAWGYGYDDFLSFDFSMGILFIEKITGDNLIDSDVTMSSSALTGFVSDLDTTYSTDLANDYPDIAAAIGDGDVFALFDEIESVAAAEGIDTSALSDLPSSDDYLGQIQEQIDTLVDSTGLGALQDMIGYAPLPVFSFGFTLFFR